MSDPYAPPKVMPIRFAVDGDVSPMTTRPTTLDELRAERSRLRNLGLGLNTESLDDAIDALLERTPDAIAELMVPDPVEAADSKRWLTMLGGIEPGGVEVDLLPCENQEAARKIVANARRIVADLVRVVRAERGDAS